MNSKLTDITLIVDRSGSMSQIKADAEGGINEFIKSQSEKPGDAVLSLVQFDTRYEFVHQAKPISDVPPYKLKPRGATALLDAVGRAINEAGIRLAATPEPDRPGLVVFVIMTDGFENSSVEFNKEKIREMIEHQQSKYNWQFVFLGADQDAFAEAGDMGIMAAGAANFSKAKVRQALMCTGDMVGRMRRSVADGADAEIHFTTKEREKME